MLLKVWPKGFLTPQIKLPSVEITPISIESSNCEPFLKDIVECVEKAAELGQIFEIGINCVKSKDVTNKFAIKLDEKLKKLGWRRSAKMTITVAAHDYSETMIRDSVDQTSRMADVILWLKGRGAMVQLRLILSILINLMMGWVLLNLLWKILDQ